MADLKADYEGKHEDSMCRRFRAQEENIEYLCHCQRFREKSLNLKNLLKTNPTTLGKNFWKSEDLFVINRKKENTYILLI